MHPEVGKIKYYDIVVEGKPTLKNGAWQYVDPPKESGIDHYKDAVAFKPKTTDDTEGIELWEDWAR